MTGLKRRIAGALGALLLAGALSAEPGGGGAIQQGFDVSVSDLVLSDEGKRARHEMPRSDASLLELGQNASEDFYSFLAILEHRYGVDRDVLIGIWGIETRFGQNVGSYPIGSALRQLSARRPDRRQFASQQLRSAMRLVDKGIVDHRDLVGSYAGALGQTQFIPTSYERFGVDGNGDGKIDLWTAKDALASTANYLHAHGWKKGQGWGMAVEVPDKFYSSPEHLKKHDVDYWKEAGVKPKYDEPWPEEGEARIERYEGGDYLLYDNYFVILTYNASREYAFSVSALGDQVFDPARPGVEEIGARFNSGANIRSDGGPRKSAGPCRSKICGLQLKLRKAGYYKGAIDGVYGPQTRKALGTYLLNNRNNPLN